MPKSLKFYVKICENCILRTLHGKSPTGTPPSLILPKNGTHVYLNLLPVKPFNRICPPEGGDLIKSCTGKLCPEAETLTLFMLLLTKIAPHDFINLEQKIAPLSYTSRIRQNNRIFLRLPYFLMDLPSFWFSCSKLSCVMHCYFCPNLVSYHPCFSLLFHFAADFDPFI